MPGPLAGLRVLELARILAGPWAGQILADLGADVIKVERTGAGDDTRGWGPPFVAAADGGHLGAAYFHATNRGKRSIELDFESEDGQRIVRKLAARSDVLIENFKVGGLAKFGLDYESLAPDNPRLIYCSVTGFGQDGPYAHARRLRPDGAGHGRLHGPRPATADGEPTRAGVPVSDIFTGVYSVVGILAALARAREDRQAAATSTRRWSTSTVGVLGQPGAQLSRLRQGAASASATRIPTSCPIRCSRSPTATSSSPPATTASSPSCAPCSASRSSRKDAALYRPTPTASPIATS